MLWSSSPTANTAAGCGVPRPDSSFNHSYCRTLVSWKLVDEDVPEARLVVLAERLVTPQQLVGAQQKLGEIDHAFSLALLVVEPVDLDEAAVEVRVDLDVLRPQALLLATVDEPGGLPRRVLLVADLLRLLQALDRRQLVARVEDLEGLRQRRVAMVGPQEAVAEPVERADPHAAEVDRQHPGQPRQHLLRGLVRERDREHAGRRHLSRLHEPRQARRQHARLAAAGAGQDQRRLRRQRDGGELLGIETGQQRRRLLERRGLGDRQFFGFLHGSDRRAGRSSARGGRRPDDTARPVGWPTGIPETGSARHRAPRSDSPRSPTGRTFAAPTRDASAFSGPQPVSRIDDVAIRGTDMPPCRRPPTRAAHRERPAAVAARWDPSLRQRDRENPVRIGAIQRAVGGGRRCRAAGTAFPAARRGVRPCGRRRYPPPSTPFRRHRCAGSSRCRYRRHTGRPHDRRRCRPAG